LSQAAQTGSSVFCHGAKVTAGFLSNGANAIASVALSALAATAICFQGQAMIAAGFFAVHQAFIIPLVIGAAIPISIFLIAAIATSCLKGEKLSEESQELVAAREALNTAEGRIVVLNSALENAERLQNEAQRERKEIENQCAELTAQLQGSRERVAEREKEIETLEEELGELQQQIRLVKKEKDCTAQQAGDRIHELETQLGQALGKEEVLTSQLRETEGLLREELTKNEKLETALQEACKEKENVVGLLNTARANLEESEHKLDEALKAKEEVEQRTSELKKHLTEKKAALETILEEHKEGLEEKGIELYKAVTSFINPEG
jgi:chromosome segregation ATPase